MWRLVNALSPRFQKNMNKCCFFPVPLYFIAYQLKHNEILWFNLEEKLTQVRLQKLLKP